MAKIITSNGIISSSAPINIKIGAASSSLYIDSGSIGIGTTTPDSTLDLESGYITLPELAIEPETANITPGKGALYLSGADSRIYFKNDLGDVFDLTKSGSAGSSTTPGDGNYSIQFNSGSTFSGSQNLIYNYITNTLSGTIGEFTTITASTIVPDKIDFNITAPVPTQEEGTLYYDGNTNHLQYWTEITGVNLNLGQQVAVRCQNASGLTLNKGTVVHIVSSSVSSDTPKITTASYDTESISAGTVGLTMTSVIDGERTYVLLYGILTGIDTNGYYSGQPLYLSSSGQFSSNKPQAPNHDVRIGNVVRHQSNNGSIFVRVQNGYELDEIHDVRIVSEQNGDLLTYDSGSGLWINSRNLSGSYQISGNLNVTGSTVLTTISGTTGQFTTVTGSTVTGSTARFGTYVAAGGSAGAAAYGFGSDTGMFLATTNVPAIATNGVEAIRLVNQVAGPQLQLANGGGVAGTPTLTWNGDNNTGIFRDVADQIGFSTNAVERFRIANTFISASVPLTGTFSGSGAGLTNLTASNISNFTNDVRSQFSAGTNITITSGVISAVTGGVGSPGGPTYSIQFNSGSTFTGSNTLTYDIPNSSLLGTNGQFSGYFIASQLTGNLSGTATDADKLDGLHASEFAQISQSNNFLANTIFTTLTASSAYISGDVVILGTASVSVLNTTTENTLQIADKYIVLASGSLGHEDLDGAGILWGTGGVGPTLGVNGEHAHVLFSNANDRLEVFPNLYVSGTFSSSDGISSSIGEFTTITASAANITEITGNVFGTSSYSNLSANSDLLDNLDSSVFAKTGSSNTFTATNTFTNNISGTTAQFNSITAGTFTGNLTGTASNADLLDGIDSSEFAKLSSNNTFTGINTFNSSITGANAFFTGDVKINGTASFTYLETLNQQSLNVGDKYIVILSGATDHASLDQSGIQWGSGGVGDPTLDNLGSNAHVRFDGLNDRIQIFPGLYVTGGTGVLFNDGLTVTGSTSLTSLTASTAQISGGLSIDGTYFITRKEDLPAPVSGIITLANNATYYFLKDVDLLGDRLVCGQNTTLIGNSSENCRLKSTGLTSADPLITSQWSLPIRFMAIEAQYALDLNASGNANQAIDWIGVNFVNTPKVGTIRDYTNFIMTDSAFLDATGLTFDGTIGTIGFSQCLLNGFSSSLGSTTITLPDTLTISRRFRAIYTSFLALAGETAISASTIASIPSEGYILDTINFSGGGTYLSGLTATDNKALFINCVNITNTSTTGFLYDLNNATNTTLTANVWAKVAGTTTAGSLNSKFTHTDNRLTYTGAFTQNFVVTVCANAASVSNNQILSVGVAKNGTIVAESEMTVRTATGGQDYPVSTQVTVQLAPNDFVEVFMRNTATSNARLTDFNMAVKKIPS